MGEIMKYSNWFAHEVGSFDDPKLIELIRRFHLEGLGAYWILVELMYRAGGKLLFAEIEEYAYVMHIEEAKLRQIVNCKAFEKDEKYFWTSGVIKQIEERKSNSQLMAELGRKGGLAKAKNFEANDKQKPSARLASAKPPVSTYIHTNIHTNKHTNIQLDTKRDGVFIIPTVEEVKNYCSERKNGIDASVFIDYYETRGWMIGKNKIKSWKAAIRTWETRNKNNNEKPKDKWNDFN